MRTGLPGGRRQGCPLSSAQMTSASGSWRSAVVPNGAGTLASRTARSGNYSLKVTGNLTIEATGTLTLKSGAGTNIESPAIVTIKGSLVKIN